MRSFRAVSKANGFQDNAERQAGDWRGGASGRPNAIFRAACQVSEVALVDIPTTLQGVPLLARQMLSLDFMGCSAGFVMRATALGVLKRRRVCKVLALRAALLSATTAQRSWLRRLWQHGGEHAGRSGLKSLIDAAALLGDSSSKTNMRHWGRWCCASCLVSSSPHLRKEP